jgi:hypothetical protein
MLADQGNLCAIGGSKCEGRELYIDHDHWSGKIRGLVCQGCNSVLGYARDQIGILNNAAEYLRGGRMLLEQMKLSPVQATELYIKLRDEKKKRDTAHKESLRRLIEAMEKIEGGLLEFLNANGVNSVASDFGTAFKMTEVSATVADKEAFMAFVKETDQFEALDIKCNKTFAKDYVEENQEPPPGVKYTTMATVGVQRK